MKTFIKTAGFCLVGFIAGFIATCTIMRNEVYKEANADPVRFCEKYVSGQLIKNVPISISTADPRGTNVAQYVNKTVLIFP